MKKLLTIVLAVALVACFASTAFAAAAAKNSELGTATATANFTTFVEDEYINFAAGEAAASQAVTINIADPHALVTEYDVTVAFDSLHFTYSWGTEANGLHWDENAHLYIAGTDAAWSAAQSIVVTNHSNRDIAVSAAFQTAAAKTATRDGITATISASDDVLDTADKQGIYGIPANADNLTYTVTVAGNPTQLDNMGDLGDTWTIDTVVISLEDDEL